MSRLGLAVDIAMEETSAGSSIAVVQHVMEATGTCTRSKRGMQH
jgi:hypothetical protein